MGKTISVIIPRIIHPEPLDKAVIVLEPGTPDEKPRNRVRVMDRRIDKGYEGYITHIEQNNVGIIIRLDSGFSLQFYGPIESIVTHESRSQEVAP